MLCLLILSSTLIGALVFAVAVVIKLLTETFADVSYDIVSKIASARRALLLFIVARQI